MNYGAMAKVLMAGSAGAAMLSPEEAYSLNLGPLAKKFKPQFSSLMDQKPRMEISDQPMRIKQLPDYEIEYGPRSLPLGDAIDHPELFANYPEFKNITLGLTKQGKGAWSNEQNRVGIQHGMSDYEAKETILHEVQHAIQDKEGFAVGGNPEQWNLLHMLQGPEYDAMYKARTALRTADRNKTDPYSFLNKPDDISINSYIAEGMNKNDAILRDRKAREKAIGLLGFGETVDSLTKKLDSAHSKISLSNYKSLSGEIESRDVSSRAGLDAEQRLRTPHYSPQGIPLENTISRFRAMAAAQALQEPDFNPVSMLAGTYGIPSMMGKLASAMSEPAMNYVTRMMKQGPYNTGNILIGR